MSKEIISNVNQLIVQKLKSSFPEDIAGLAIEAVQLSENLPEDSVFEALLGLVRKAAREQGGTHDTT